MEREELIIGGVVGGGGGEEGLGVGFSSLSWSILNALNAHKSNGNERVRERERARRADGKYMLMCR